MACLGIGLFLLAYPNYVIWPWRSQGAGELRAALLVLRFRGAVGIVAAIAALVAAIAYWRAERGAWRRTGVALAAAGVILCAALSRVNIYEMMFHPVSPAFDAAAQSTLDGDEKVIAIAVGGAARAYPVRSISYHHIVNDLVDGVPIVATY
jgi:hypothetical protein